MMIDPAAIMHDLDLLDDWLSGKGYGEEAGLVLRSMTLINKQERELRELRASKHDLKQARELRTLRAVAALPSHKYYQAKIDPLRAENEKLRAALKQIAERDAVEMVLDPQWAKLAAAAALKETEK